VLIVYILLVGEGRRESNDDQPATESSTDQGAGRKLTVSEAAESLGISPDAVRSRIKRGTLPTMRDGGRVFVALGSPDRPTDRQRPTTRTSGDSSKERLYQEMIDRIRYLERQVEEEREARRRADTLLARLMDRMPELEAPADTPPGTPGAPEIARDGGEEGEAPRPRRGLRSAPGGVGCSAEGSRCPGG
jgi:excisionase family DNA binding protein